MVLANASNGSRRCSHSSSWQIFEKASYFTIQRIFPITLSARPPGTADMDLYWSPEIQRDHCDGNLPEILFVDHVSLSRISLRTLPSGSLLQQGDLADSGRFDRKTFYSKEFDSIRKSSLWPKGGEQLVLACGNLSWKKYTVLVLLTISTWWFPSYAKHRTSTHQKSVFDVPFVQQSLRFEELVMPDLYKQSNGKDAHIHDSDLTVCWVDIELIFQGARSWDDILTKSLAKSCGKPRRETITRVWVESTAIMHSNSRHRWLHVSSDLAYFGVI